MWSRLDAEPGRIRLVVAAVAGLLIMVTAGSAVVVIAARGPIPPPVRSADATRAPQVPPVAGAPDVAVVSCRGSGIETDTPVVQARPDGVHLTVSGSPVLHVRDPENPADDVGSSLLARGFADIRRHFPPGDLWIGCPGEPRSSDSYHRNWVWFERLVRLTVTD